MNIRFFDDFKKTRSLIGEEVFGLYIKAAILGFFWFVTESSFIFILQGFLLSLGIMIPGQVMLPSWYPDSLLATSFILVAYGMVRSFIIFSRNYLSGAVGQIFNRTMRERFLTYSLHNVQTIPMHEIVSVFNERIQQAGALLQYFVFFIINLISLGFFFFLGLKLAPLELVIGLSILLLFLYPLQKLNETISNNGHELVKEWNTVSQTLITGFKNFFFLKFYNLIDEEIDKGKNSLRLYQDNYLNFHWLASLKLAFPILLGSIVVSFITFMSFRYWKTPGAVLLTFYYIFIRIAQGASDTSTVLGIVKLNFPGFKILLEWHKKMSIFEKQQQKLTQGEKIVPFNADISVEVKNISFAYHSHRKILNDVSLSIKKGDVLVIRGESGAGKSTLISLIAGFNQPTEGGIFVNGQSLIQCQKSLLLSTGYVGPEPFLIAGTVSENLLYGYSSQVSESDLWTALEIAQLKNEVIQFKQGLAEPLNELTQLSTGQKQRLSLARALVRKPKLLILDEATANLDPETEREFIQKLQLMSKDLTMIIISHKNTFNDIATQTLELKKL